MGTTNGTLAGTANGTPRDLLDALLKLLLAVLALTRRLARAGPWTRSPDELCCRALTASGLEVEHLGAANRAGRLPGRTWGVRSDRELGRFRRHGSTRGVGLVFATLLLPRFGPCLQPSPEALAPSPRFDVMREAR